VARKLLQVAVVPVQTKHFGSLLLDQVEIGSKDEKITGGKSKHLEIFVVVDVI